MVKEGVPHILSALTSHYVLKMHTPDMGDSFFIPYETFTHSFQA